MHQGQRPGPENRAPAQLEQVFTDKASGKNIWRPQLEELLRFIRDGDTLVVHGMDRLARNLDDLLSFV